MKWITLLLAIVLPLFMTSCAVVPASNGYYSRYYEDRMNPSVFYYYNGGFRSHYFHDYDRDRYYKHGHHSGYHHDYDRDHDHDHDHDHGHHYDHDRDHGYHHR